MSINLQQLFDSLWEAYLPLSPDAKAIHALFADNNGHVVNDHIALRTFNLPGIGISKMADPFLAAGYVEGGEYTFPARKLYAKHFQHQDPTLPKVFISELLVEQLSENAGTLIRQLIEQLDSKPVKAFPLCLMGRPWQVSIRNYETLVRESEYAGWVAAHGFVANHFTVSVNHLGNNITLEQVNDKILKAGFAMNDSSGLIKGSPEVLLEQSSTLAGNIRVTFLDGEKVIPGCFYEFAKRYPLRNGDLYQGFVVTSADKIFESTDRRDKLHRYQ